MNMRDRLPTPSQTRQAYAVIAALLYGWTLYWYIWKIPSWIYYLTLGEIFEIYAYAASVNLLESLLLLAGGLLAAALLPRKWLADFFAAQSAAFLLVFLGYLMYVSYRFAPAIEKYYPQEAIRWLPIVITLALLLAWLPLKWLALRRILAEFASRLVIFLYILVPFSVLSALYVIVKNLWWSVLER